MKTIILSLAIIFSNICLAQHSYSIEGQLKNTQKGKIYLLINNKENFKDSTNIINGKFKFSGTIKEISNAFLSFDPSFENNVCFFYVEPAKIKISGNSRDLGNLKIDGSKINDEDISITNQMHNILQWENQTNKEYGKSLIENNKRKIDSLDDVFINILKEKRKIVSQFIFNHPRSLYSPMLISKYYNYESNDLEVAPLFNSLSQDIKNSKQGTTVKKMLDAYSRVSIGKIMPEITQYDSSGQKITINSLRGNYVLVDFWASWCDPCRRANPSILNLYNEFHNKGFEVLGISYDKAKESWVQAIRNDKLPWVNISELKGWHNSTSDYFFIKDIPANFLLDREGKIVAKNISIQELRKKLGEVL